MTAKERIQIIRIMEKAKRKPEYFKKIGVELCGEFMETSEEKE